MWNTKITKFVVVSTILLFILPTLVTGEFKKNDEEVYYGFIVSLPMDDEDNYDNYEQQKIVRYMVNDLLRNNISVYWVSSNFTAVSSTMFSNSFFQNNYKMGDFIIPFTGNQKKDALINVLIIDYYSNHELNKKNETGPDSFFYRYHRYRGDNAIFKLREPFVTDAYKLVEPKIAHHIGKAFVKFKYTFTSNGFLNVNYISDGEIKNELNNKDYNVFFWPGGTAAYYGFKVLLRTAFFIRDHIAIRNFISNGGGYIGSCYGAYTASSGLVKPFAITAFYNKRIPSTAFLSITDTATSIAFPSYYSDITEKIINTSHPVTFGIKGDIIQSGWAGGPVFNWIGNNTETIAVYHNASNTSHNFSFLKPDTREKWINNTLGKASWISSQFGDGKIIAFGSHPEIKHHPIIPNALFYTTSKKEKNIQITLARPINFFYQTYQKTRNLTIENGTSPELKEARDLVYKIKNYNLSILLKNVEEILKDETFFEKNRLNKRLEEKIINMYYGAYYLYSDFIHLFYSFKNLDSICFLYSRVSSNVSDKQKINNYVTNSIKILEELEKEIIKQKIILENISSIAESNNILLNKIKLILLCHKMDMDFDYWEKPIFDKIDEQYFKTLRLLRILWYEYESILGLRNQ